MVIRKNSCLAALAAIAMFQVTACGGSDDDATLPQLPAATGATLSSCTDLVTRLSFPNTSIASSATVAAGTLTVAGTPIAAHCLVKGSMYSRVSTVDGNSYAIGFEMRLPNTWNGRFFYQANGGIDGSVVAATGPVDGGAGLTNALAMGFAVISSDAGHPGTLGPFFGLDPQARLDYGYQASARLTPMAKAAIAVAYGKGPDRSYFGGCSNGGRHTLVAASRLAQEYDGFLAGDPGTRLPLAAIANIAAIQAYARIATDPEHPATAYTPAEQALVARAVLAKCDALDGAADGLVQDTAACQAAFDIGRDVPTCSGARDGNCLTTAQKQVIAQRFAGEPDGQGRRIYASFPFDGGIGSGNTTMWNFTAPLQRDSGAVAFIWSVPPEARAGFDGTAFALHHGIDDMLARIRATDSNFTEDAMAFMTPPSPSDLSALQRRGGKVLVYHGTSDPIFSSDDTTAWYEALARANGGDARHFARFYRVPGMTHCSDGPATDQFDMLSPLVDWVEQGRTPQRVIATARGAGNPAGVNASVPKEWAPDRTRPLCPYPQVARYDGRGNVESAESFSCR